jgi:hypothetical protein
MLKGAKPLGTVGSVKLPGTLVGLKLVSKTSIVPELKFAA